MAKFLLKTLRGTFVAVVAVAFLMPVSLAQGGGGGGNKGGSPSGNNQGTGQPAGNNQGSGQPANNQSANSPGITSGSMAIESTLFAYKALAEDADKISAAVKDKIKSNAVVIATPPDFANLLQWRTTMYQAGLLHERATAATQTLDNIQKPNFFVNVPKNVPKLGAFLASASDLQTLIQTLASIFAVNETLSTSSGFRRSEERSVECLSIRLMQTRRSSFEE